VIKERTMWLDERLVLWGRIVYKFLMGKPS